VNQFPKVERYYGELIANWVALVRLFEETHQPQQAKEVWRRALVQVNKLVQANPDDASVANWLAWACTVAPATVDDCKTAVRLVELATRNDPKNATFSATLGAVLFRAGRIEESIEHLDKATKTFQALPSLRDTLCLSDRREGDHHVQRARRQ
jgi:Flp pilus assembly protein TadD